MDMYERGAQFYDLIQANRRVKKDYAAEALKIKAIIRSRNPAARTLLDIACGTGLHLSYLRERYDVQGVDASAPMISVARQRLPTVPLHIADMRTLDLGERFDAITCMFASIGYVPEVDLKATIQRFADHLHQVASSCSMVGSVQKRGSMPAGRPSNMSPTLRWRFSVSISANVREVGPLSPCTT